MPEAIERRLLGIVEVDSGTLLVGDPAYALPSKEDGKPGIDYEAVIQSPGDQHGAQLRGRPVVLIANFGGDGAYPVFGEFEDGELLRAIVEFEPLEIGDGE